MHDNNVIGWPANATPNSLQMHKLYCDLVVGWNLRMPGDLSHVIEIDTNAEKLGVTAIHFPFAAIMAEFEREFSLEALTVLRSISLGTDNYLQLRNEFPDDIIKEFFSSIRPEKDAVIRTLKSAGDLNLKRDNAFAAMYLVANNLNKVHSCLTESFAILAERVKERELQDT